LQPHRELGRFVKNGHLQALGKFMADKNLRDPSFKPEQQLYQGLWKEILWYEWLNFLYSFGGDMLDVKSGSECGPVIVNSPRAVASLEYYKSRAGRRLDLSGAYLCLCYSPPGGGDDAWSPIPSCSSKRMRFP